MKLYFLGILLLLASCTESQTPDAIINDLRQDNPLVITEVETYYQNNVNDSITSISSGSVGKGQLKHATLLPFSGSNYQYFDTSSYLMGRGFMHTDVANIILAAMEELDSTCAERKFYIMESSLKQGGKLDPHRTHQNGLSVDFLCPKLKDNQPYYELDTIGALHYFLAFNDQGQLNKDTSVCLDFESIAQEILALNNAANQYGYSIEKVIFKLELKDELFATKTGKLLQQKNIYFARHLDKMVNDVHDDHFHIDFKKIK